MKKYMTLFLTNLFIIVMATNIRTDIPFWKQFIGYMVIAAIVPCAKFMENAHQTENKINA